MTNKQIIYSKKKALAFVRKMQLRLFLVLMLSIALPATVFAITDTENSTETISVLGTTTMASMLAIGNIEDVPDIDVSGEALSYKVWLVEYSQIDSSKPFPKPNLMREISGIPLKSNEKIHHFMAHDIPEYSSSGERGDLTINATNTFSIVMGGVRDQLLNFIEQYAGGKFLIIFQECGKDEKYLIGSPCKPMILKNFNLKNNKENRSVTFSFENKSIRQYLKYKGSLASAEPILHPAGTKTLTIQSGVDDYRIPNGTSSTYAINAIAGLTPNDEGRYINLIGEGTNNAATISSSETISLKNSETWTAATGHSITFRVFDKTKIIEVSRS